MNSHEEEQFASLMGGFEGLERAVLDPLIDPIVTEAKDWDHYFRGRAVSPEEAAAVLEHLDASLLGRLSVTEVVVSGVISYADAEYDEHYVDGANMLIARADLSAVQLEFVAMSYERARAWLEVFTPDILNEIDETVLNGDGDTEAVIFRLQELNLDLSHLTPEDRERAGQFLSIYLGNVIACDTEVPYIAQVAGRILAKDDQGDDAFMTLLSTDKVFLYTHRLLVLSLGEGRTDTGTIENLKTEIYIDATIAPNHGVHQQSYKAFVPLDSINHLESIRPLIP